MSEPTSVTLVLAQIRAGDPDASNRLIALIYDDLKRMAAGSLRRERPDHSLQATALVHEAYIRLAGSDQSWESRAHFFGAAANCMRQVLTDHARRHRTVKRGAGAARIDLDENLTITPNKLEEVLAVDEALQRLSEVDIRMGRVVELRYFAGLSVEETAEVMSLSPETVKRDWRAAKAWLHQQFAVAR